MAIHLRARLVIRARLVPLAQAQAALETVADGSVREPVVLVPAGQDNQA